MALKIESRTIRLYEFEIQLLDRLKTATGKTEEELLLGYVRAGLIKERHENVSYEKSKQEAALALLEAEGQAAYSSSTDSHKKAKSRRPKPNGQTFDPSGQTDSETSESAIPEPTLEVQFLELAERFGLPEVTIKQIQPSEFYLMRGRKQIRVITIVQINDTNSVQYQLYNVADQKLHTAQLKGLTNNLRGPILTSVVTQLESELAN